MQSISPRIRIDEYFIFFRKKKIKKKKIELAVEFKDEYSPDLLVERFAFPKNVLNQAVVLN